MIPFQLLSRQVFCCCPRVTGFLGSLLQVQPSRIGWILGRQSLEGRGPEPRRGRGVPTVCSRKPHCLLLALAGNLWILDFTMLTVSSAFTMTPQKVHMCFRRWCVMPCFKVTMLTVSRAPSYSPEGPQCGPFHFRQAPRGLETPSRKHYT